MAIKRALPSVCYIGYPSAAILVMSLIPLDITITHVLYLNVNSSLCHIHTPESEGNGVT